MHGGDIYSNKIKIDFSVNLNPLGIPQRVRDAVCNNIECIKNYPDQENDALQKKLIELYKNEYHINISPASVAFGNGASELIPSILRANHSKKVLLVTPGFTGYKKAVDSVGAEIEKYCLQEKNDFELGFTEVSAINEILNSKKPDTFIITNPNNPNGRLIQPEIIDLLIDSCRKLNIFLIIDECFMELTGKSKTHSAISKLKDNDKIVILRAFTKTFAIPGIRLGYCLCRNSNVCSSIKNQLPEWNISTVAQTAGLQALNEFDYVKNACSVITNNREYMIKKLKALGFRVYTSDSNFVLFKSEEIKLKEKLLDKQILIRDCSDYDGLNKGFYRVAVKLSDENEMLIDAIKEVL